MTETGGRYPSEIFTFANRAQQLFNFWNVETRLNLDGDDKLLGIDYMTERLIRAQIYESSSYLNSAHAAIRAKLGIFARSLTRLDMVDRNNRRAQDQVNHEIEKTKKLKYRTPERQRRARTLELAINDLIARATPDPLQNGDSKNLSLSKEELDVWTQRWEPILQQ